MPTAEHVLEEAEEELNRPAVLINIGDHFGRHVEQIRRDPQDAVGRWSGGSSLATTRLLMRRGLYQNNADRMLGSSIARPDLDENIADDARLAGRCG